MIKFGYMIIRSKAPLRLGIAGGGTDLEPYSNLFGGFVLNATLSLYAHCTLEITDSGFIEFDAVDLGLTDKCHSTNFLKLNGKLDLHKAVYNRVVKDFNDNQPLSFKLTTHCDSPPGSGLGSSSTLVVSMLKVFVELLAIPLGEYEIANIAFQIEREEVGLSGGKQDQYAATFGGFNFMEFAPNNKVIINPLRIKTWIKDELEARIILYYTGISRSSELIINDQVKNTQDNDSLAIEAMHRVKETALNMKEAVLKGDMIRFGEILSSSWENKKKMSNKISSPHIEEIFTRAMENGAIAGKVSGAGGGGFMMLFVDPIDKVKVINSLETLSGYVVNFNFSNGGCHCWKVV
jgi:D-glycero-alpha-D-manno-heptose-7-phosphate kinase